MATPYWPQVSGDHLIWFDGSLCLISPPSLQFSRVVPSAKLASLLIRLSALWRRRRRYHLPKIARDRRQRTRTAPVQGSPSPSCRELIDQAISAGPLRTDFRCATNGGRPRSGNRWKRKRARIGNGGKKKTEVGVIGLQLGDRVEWEDDRVNWEDHPPRAFHRHKFFRLYGRCAQTPLYT